MRNTALLAALGLPSLVLLAAAAGAQQPVSAAAQGAAAPTIKEIMASRVHPAANALWGGDGKTVSLQGVDRDGAWAEAGKQALVLAEASNALFANRRVVRPAEQLGDPRFQMDPAQIEALIGRNSGTWRSLVHDMRSFSSSALSAIEAKDAERLSAVGAQMAEVCETCHVQFGAVPLPAEPCRSTNGTTPTLPASLIVSQSGKPSANSFEGTLVFVQLTPASCVQVARSDSGCGIARVPAGSACTSAWDENVTFSLAPGDYEFHTYTRTCDGNCRALDPPRDECGTRFTIKPGETLQAQIARNGGLRPCTLAGLNSAPPANERKPQ